MTTLFDTTRTPITLGPMLKRGGEGAVHLVPGQPRLLAKLYHPTTRPAEAKLAWMRDHPPADPTVALGHVSIAWPRDLLFDAQGRCLGFLMPYARHTVPILHVFNPRLRSRFGLSFDWTYLHRTARNLAAAVGAVHACDYVVGDLNEGNVLVAQTALVTLIDTDSFQVRQRGGPRPTVHRCLVGKLEYTPPELHGRSFQQAVREPHHDAFGLAVLIFQLLMAGNHPFRADWRGRGDPPSLVAKIEQGLFPHQKPAPGPVAPPPNMPTLDVLHPEVAFLCRRCFGDGHRDPTRRPTAAEWENALEAAEQALVACRAGHVYSGHLARCPWCRARSAGSQVPLPVPPPSPPTDRRSSISPPRRPPASPFPTTAASTPGGRPWRWPIAAVAVLVLALLGVAAGGNWAMLAAVVPGLGQITGVARDPGLAAGCWESGQSIASGMDESDQGAVLRQWTAPPALVIDPARRYTATLETGAGVVDIELLPQIAPTAVNNFVCLARAGFYDGTSFHRVIAGTLVQGGDPTGTGRGGPGYRFAAEPVAGGQDGRFANRTYRRGALAMANTGPDTNGSQFFIVLADLAGRLPPGYPIFGRVTAGRDVLDAIAAAPTAPGPAGAPLAPVRLERVLIAEEEW